MESVKKILGIKENSTSFISPERQSVEQVEDYAFKKVVDTKELIVNGTSITGSGSGNAPTNYLGSNFVGVNPNKTLTHVRNLPATTMLIIGGRVMHRTLEYTIAGAVITMVNVDIEDTDNIMVVE